jgi:putative transcriptional regulator
MPIVIKLENILIQKKMPFSALIEKTGIARSNLSVLNSNRAKLIRFSTLNAICKALDCQPGDIMEYIADEEKASSTNSSRLKEVERL